MLIVSVLYILYMFFVLFPSYLLFSECSIFLTSFVLIGIIIQLMVTDSVIYFGIEKTLKYFKRIMFYEEESEI